MIGGGGKGKGGGGGGGGGMVISGKRKCFAVDKDGNKKEVPCGGGGGGTLLLFHPLLYLRVSRSLCPSGFSLCTLIYLTHSIVREHIL